MRYSNSPLVQYTKISPNKTTSNRKPIDRITIHHAAGNILVESMGEMFARAAQRSSSNYGVGSNGKIAMYVEEAHSSWCSSSTANDTRAVTIEVANSSNTDSNWPVSDAALESTIKLVADICKRNGKNKLVYFADKNTALNYSPKSNEMLLTRHDFFKQKVCLPLFVEVKTRDEWVPLSKIKVGDEIVVADFKDGDSKVGFYFSPVRDVVEPYDDEVYTNHIISATRDHAVAIMMNREDDENGRGIHMKTLEEMMTVSEKVKKISEMAQYPDGEDVEMILNQVVVPIGLINEINSSTSKELEVRQMSFKPSQITYEYSCKVGCVSVDTGLIVIRSGKMGEIDGRLIEVTSIVSNCPGPYLGGKFPYIVERVNNMLGTGGVTVSGTITATSSEPSSVGTGITSSIKANMKYGKLTDKNGTLINVPDGLGTTNTYMHWQKIKSDSLQKDLRTAAGMKFDSNGYGIIDGRYVIAMTDTFGQVGDMVDICRDGSVLKGIIGDIKDQTTAHGTPANKWGHDNGKSIVEFIVDEKVVKSQTHINETVPGKNKGSVLHVENKGNWFINHENDPAPSTSTSTSSDKFPYLVRVTDDELNIRQGPGTDYPVIGVIKDRGVYTILAESTGKGAKLWGQLKPVMGNGWISLGFTKPV